MREHSSVYIGWPCLCGGVEGGRATIPLLLSSSYWLSGKVEAAAPLLKGVKGGQAKYKGLREQVLIEEIVTQERGTN